MISDSPVCVAHAKKSSSDVLIHNLSVSTNNQQDISGVSQDFLGLRFNSTPKMLDSMTSLNRTQVHPIVKEHSPRRRKFDNNIYAELVLLEVSPEPLISHFTAEDKSARPSNAANVDFSLNSCLGRLKRQQYVYLFDYNKPGIKEVALKVRPSGLEVKGKGLIPYTNFVGVFLGKGSTLAKFGYKFKDLDYDDCISLVGNSRTVDLYTSSQILKYDLIIAVSWYISVNTTCPSSIAFTKSN